jgi:hypothetical protein
LTQKEIFGAIWLRKHKMFDEVFAGGSGVGAGAGRADEAAAQSLDEQYQ